MLASTVRNLSTNCVIHPHHVSLQQPEFYEVCHTKKDYDEHGPSICRHNPVFGTMS